MAVVSRRNFIKKVINAGSGVMAFGTGAQLMTTCNSGAGKGDGIKVFIPMPLQVVIDDVGWWSGKDSSTEQGPYRTGINRNHVPADYQAIVDLGRALGIRPQAAFVISEWDRENILRELPTGTWMGREWDNSRWVGPWLEESAEIINQNREYFEITVHGVGHEYWEGGSFTRAEWTDSNGQMRPREQVELHLDYFGKIMNQNNLGPFPGSFVPAAFRHSFGPSEGRQVSLAEILMKWGIGYVNTPFSSIYHRERVQYEYFGFDSEVMTIDRGNDEFPWLIFPADPAAEIAGPTCGLHWPNMLHPDPDRNKEVVDRWVKYLRPCNERPDRMLARNSEAFQSQLMHHTLTQPRIVRNSIELDFSEVDKLPVPAGTGELTIKILSENPVRFRADGVTITSQLLREETGYLYVLNLKREIEGKHARIRIT